MVTEMPDLHVAPEDTGIPYPVTLGRVVTALEQATGEEVTAGASGAQFTYLEERFAFNFVSGGDYMSLRTSWETPPLNQSAQSALFTAVNTWNHDHYFPTVYWRVGDGGRFQVVADMVCGIRHGLSDAQLRDEVAQALSNCSDALNYLQWVSGNMERLK